MEDEKIRDALNYEMQEKELKKKRHEVISVKKQLFPLLNRDGNLREDMKERVIKEFCEGDRGRK